MRCARRVDPDRAAGRGDRREALVEALAHRRGVEIDMVAHPTRRLRHPRADRRGDHVARCEVLLRMDTCHHPLAGSVEQDCAFPANGLAHQRLLPTGVGAAPHHRRMELHELHVADRQPGAHRHRRPIAGYGRRIRRGREHLAVATGRQHNRTGSHDTDGRCRTGGIEHGDADPGCLTVTANRRPDNHVEGVRPLEHLDSGGESRLVERSLHLGATAVAARVNDAMVTVPALAAEGRLVAVVGGGVERRPQPHQIADRRRRLGDELAHHRLIAQPGAGRERVADVVLQRVGGVEDGGEPALGPRRGAGRQRSLGDDEGAAHRSRGQARRRVRRRRNRRSRRRRAAPTKAPARQVGPEAGASERPTQPLPRACRWRSSARPMLERGQRCRVARRPRRRRRARTATVSPE